MQMQIHVCFHPPVTRYAVKEPRIARGMDNLPNFHNPTPSAEKRANLRSGEFLFMVYVR